jgi:hypothetical protein
MRLTLGDFKRQFARFTTPGACPEGDLVIEKINEARCRIMTCSNGNWNGTVGYVSFCINSACLTLPKEIQTVQAVAIEDAPLRPRNQWYELLTGGPGGSLRGGWLNGSIVDRGEGHVLFQGIGSTPLAIKVYSDQVEDATAEILIQGFGGQATRVRTNHDGTIVDGEYVAIDNATPATSVTEWVEVTGIIKPRTNGFVSLYAVNADATETLLAIYHPDETVPSFKRYYIPFLDREDQDWPVNLKAFVSFRYVPVYQDYDDLLITNPVALKQMLLCMNQEEAGNVQLAKYYEDSCFAMLAAEAARVAGPQTITGPPPQDEGMNMDIPLVI